MVEDYCLRDALAEACRRLHRDLYEIRVNVKLMKKYSQHFMRSCKIGYAFVRELRKLNPRTIFELGAGAGFLTRFLAALGRPVIAIESDPRMLNTLATNVADLPVVHPLLSDGIHLLKSKCINADVLASNTPYSLTGPVLIAYIRSNMKAAVLMLQREVARRLTSTPGSRDYGRITIIANYFNDVKPSATFKPRDFFPSPKVSSQLVVLRRIREWKPEHAFLEAILRCMFSQRRKIAKNVLRKCLRHVNPCIDVEMIVDILKKRNLENARVYELDIDTYSAIYESLQISLKNTHFCNERSG